MAFRNRNMSVIAYANGFTLWHYKADEGETLKSIIDNPKYFTPIYTLINVGDIIIINAEETGMRVIDEIKGSELVKLGNLK